MSDTYRPEKPVHTRIVATIGPASDSFETLAKLIEAGVSIFRLNFSHGDLDGHAVTLRTIREAGHLANRPIAVMGDLQGPKLRITHVPDVDPQGGMMIDTGTDVIFRAGVNEAFIEDGIPVFGSTFDPLFHDVLPGQRVLINDGAVRMLAVDATPGEELRCRVTFGGLITTGKGINLPESDLNVPALTPGDWKCAEWAVQHGLDYLALSFVRKPADVLELKEGLAGMCPADRSVYNEGIGLEIPIVAKIEKPQAVENIDAIVAVTDAIMVARGDLGVEMDVAYVPIAQRLIIRKCIEYGKPVIVATQMLESMITSATPTRAEANDVAGAVLQGADAVMLSGETAVGKHPTLVVETMRRIISVTEAGAAEFIDPKTPDSTSKLEELPYRSAALANGALEVAASSNAKAIVTWSQAGGMARYLSRTRLDIPILAYTSSEVAARRMALLAGVTPIRCDPPVSGRLRDWTDLVEHDLKQFGIARDGDIAVLLAGKPLGALRTQDLLAMLRLGDPSSGFRAQST